MSETPQVPDAPSLHRQKEARLVGVKPFVDLNQQGKIPVKEEVSKGALRSECSSADVGRLGLVEHA